MDLFELVAESAGIEVGGPHARRARGDAMSVAFKSAIDDAVIDELRAIIGDDDRVLPNLSSRVNRTRVPAPFPVHRWADHMPDVAVLPKHRRRRSRRSSSSPTACGIPIVPRAGGTGLSDGAVPLRGGILVDVKLMNQIHEIDLVDRTVTVGPGINMLKLNEELRPHGVFYPDDPASLPVLARRRAHRHRRLVAAGRALRPHARQRDLDAGRAADRRDRRDRRGRRPQAAQVLDRRSTSSSCSPATRARSASRTEATLELAPRPEVEFAAFFAFDDYMKAYETTGVLDQVAGWRRSPASCSSTSGRSPTCAATTRPTSRSRESVQAVVAVAMYGRRVRGRAGLARW